MVSGEEGGIDEGDVGGSGTDGLINPYYNYNTHININCIYDIINIAMANSHISSHPHPHLADLASRISLSRCPFARFTHTRNIQYTRTLSTHYSIHRHSTRTPISKRAGSRAREHESTRPRVITARIARMRTRNPLPHLMCGRHRDHFPRRKSGELLLKPPAGSSPSPSGGFPG